MEGRCLRGRPAHPWPVRPIVRRRFEVAVGKYDVWYGRACSPEVWKRGIVTNIFLMTTRS